MKSKGFTLIELLAVILILGIIALIAIPVVSNIIKDSKNNANLRSIDGYIKAVENASMKSILNPNNEVKESGVYTVAELKGKVDYKGKGPTEGWVQIDSNAVIDYSLKIDDSIINYNKTTERAEISSDEFILDHPGMVSYEKYDVGSVVYFNPVDTTKCDESIYSKYGTSEFNKASVGNCYRWRVIETDDSTDKSSILLQLDHNIVTFAIWSPANNTTGPVSALNTLNNLTESWTRVSPLNFQYDTSKAQSNYGLLKCVSGNCTIGSTVISKVARARMITGEEVCKIAQSEIKDQNSLPYTWNISIGGTTGWYYFSNSNKNIGYQTSGIGNNNLSWMVENMYDYSPSGSSYNYYGDKTYGYWTLSPIANESQRAWIVGDYGWFGYDTGRGYVYYTEGQGIRPVITISKSLLK